MKEFLFWLVFVTLAAVGYVLVLIIFAACGIPEYFIPAAFLLLGYVLNDLHGLIFKIYRKVEHPEIESEMKCTEDEKRVIRESLKVTQDRLMHKRLMDMSDDEINTINTIANIIKRL